MCPDFWGSFQFQRTPPTRFEITRSGFWHNVRGILEFCINEVKFFQKVIDGAQFGLSPDKIRHEISSSMKKKNLESGKKQKKINKQFLGETKFVLMFFHRILW